MHDIMCRCEKICKACKAEVLRFSYNTLFILDNYVKMNILEMCLMISWPDSMESPFHLLPLYQLTNFSQRNGIFSGRRLQKLSFWFPVNGT